MMTDSASKMKIPLAITRTRSVSVMNAITASVAPRERDQTSPINTCAGRILNHRKAISAPTMIRQNAVRMNSHFEYEINPYIV